MVLWFREYRLPLNHDRENFIKKSDSMAIGLYRTEWKGGLAGQPRENVLYWRMNPDPGGNGWDTSRDLVNALATTFKPLWLGMLPPEYYLSCIFARQVGPLSSSYQSVDYEEFTEAGTLGDGAVAEQLCPCVTLIPPMGVKSAGRVFLPAVSKNQITLNAPVAGYLTAIAAFFDAAIAGFSVAGGTASLGIYSRKLNISSEVSSYNLSPVIGYQRRRATPIGQ